MNKVKVFPEPGESMAALGRALLDAAKDPADVFFVAGENCFEVPEEVAAAVRQSATPKKRRKGGEE